MITDRRFKLPKALPVGTFAVVAGDKPVHAFASTTSWIEGNATQHFDQVASRDGVIAVAGMPDLHPGKYGPIGAAILADRIFPELAHSGIGCGMGLFQPDVATRKLRLDKLAGRMCALD